MENRIAQSLFAAVLLILLLLLAGCDQLTAQLGTPTPEPTATATPLPPTATATDTPEPTPTDTATPTPEPLTPSAIFEQLSPSVAHISVADGSGSGALLEGGYVLTNAHVVWPFDAAEVTFPNGENHEDVPLAAYDALRDIALLGPIETALPPIQFVDGESAVVGSDILLIGYPGESRRAPQPTLTEGLISRVREWEGGGITFFQTSSAVAGGQSGGIAVSPDGDPVGLSGLRFTEANYGLIASAADVMAHVERLLVEPEGQALDEIEPRAINSDRWTFETVHDQRAYRFDVADTDVSITVDGPTDAILSVAYSDGQEEVYADDRLFGEETAQLTTPAEAVPMFVIVGYDQDGTGPIPFTMTSNTPLTPIEDVDDGQRLQVGGVYTGTIDFPYDGDTFEIPLGEGQLVNLYVDSISFSPFLVIDAKMGLEQMIGGGGNGGGLFDSNAEVTYRAPRAGTYGIVVYDTEGKASGGGYTLSVREPYEGAPTPLAPAPTATPIAAALGPMRIYDRPDIPFTIEMPFSYVDDPRTVNCRTMVMQLEALACLSNPDSTSDELAILLFTEDAQDFGLQTMTLDDLTTTIRGALAEDPTFGNVTESRIETAQGQPAAVIATDLAGTGVRMTRLLTVEDERFGYYVTFLHYPEEQALVDYIISTFKVK